MKRKVMKKIAVQKNDEASFVIEQVLDTKEDYLALSLPKGSKFAQSVSNFSLLKKQADLLGKELRVESVDEDALAMAAKAGIEANNPFFGRMEARKQFSDIVVSSPAKDKNPQRAEKVKKSKAVHSVQVRDIDDGRSDEEEGEFIKELREEMGDEANDTEAAHIFHHHNDETYGDFPVASFKNKDGELQTKHYQKSKKKFSFKKFLFLGLTLLILIAAFYLALVKLPKAEIVLSTNKEPWSYNGSIIASKNMSSIDFRRALIPAELFSQKVNRSFQFKANGEEFIERKAVGTIIVYNAFNSESQPLVATTRFQTPDGKIFRIVSDVTVPGARIESGQIVPSNIEVDIIADEPGDEYNVGPVARLTIPGFSGTERFNGFYGEIAGATSGGFIGNSVVATVEDRESALREARESIKNGANTLLSSKIPEGFVTLQDAGGFEIVRERVDDRADGNGMFSVFIEAQVFQLAFKEDDVEKLLAQMAVADFSDEYEVASDKVEFNRIIPNFDDGTLTLDLSYDSVLRKKIAVQSFKENVAGQNQSVLHGMVSSLPGLSRADISLWPFWVSKVPKDSQRINVVVN